MKRATWITLLTLSTLLMPPLHASTELLGAGATFPYPLYAKLFNEYSKKKNVKVNYQSIGSGGGIRQLLNKTVDFGATDSFMNDTELRESPGKIIHIPTCLGAVALSYNLPGAPQLKLSGTTIANIFLGKIKVWNDPQIQKENPTTQLPKLPIVVAHRSDGSGTTAIFSDYLSKINPEWKKRIGNGTSLNWPTGIGAKGNEGVAGILKLTPGSIGYIELIYAKQNKMKVAYIQNKSGFYIDPTLSAITAAAETTIPSDTRVSITDTPNKNGYPISGFTWIIIYQEQSQNKNPIRKATELTDLLWWITHEGQAYTQPLNYAPLPKNLQTKAEVIIKSITYKGVKLGKI